MTQVREKGKQEGGKNGAVVSSLPFRYQFAAGAVAGVSEVSFCVNYYFELPLLLFFFEGFVMGFSLSRDTLRSQFS